MVLDRVWLIFLSTERLQRYAQIEIGCEALGDHSNARHAFFLTLWPIRRCDHWRSDKAAGRNRLTPDTLVVRKRPRIEHAAPIDHEGMLAQLIQQAGQL